MGETNLGDVFFVIVSLGFYGVLIIQKWLIKVSGSIVIFLNDFGNFEHLVKIWTRRPPNFYQNVSKIQELLWEHP